MYNDKVTKLLDAEKAAEERQYDQLAKTIDENTMPSLPVWAFPETLQTIIKECADVHGSSADMWAAAVLSASATALGNSIQLRSKYINSALLWIVLVAPSGAGKTEPGRFAFAPLHHADSERIEEYNRARAEYDAAFSLPKAERPTDLQSPTPPAQIIFSDATPEALLHGHGNNKRGIVIQYDELHGYILNVGRYNNSGELQNMLSAWSEQPMTVNRKGGDPLKIERPFICLYGGIQPGLLNELAKDGRGVNGFVHRLCFIYPDDQAKPAYRDGELPAELTQTYYTYIQRLLSFTGPEEIVLSLDAQTQYKDWYNLNRQLVNLNPNSPLAEAYNKLDIIVLRMALILHAANRACTGQVSDQISPDTMKGAIAITEYFRASVKKVHKQLFSGSPQLDAKSVIKWLHNQVKDGERPSQRTIATAVNCSLGFVNKCLKS